MRIGIQDLRIHRNIIYQIPANLPIPKIPILPILTSCKSRSYKPDLATELCEAVKLLSTLATAVLSSDAVSVFELHFL